MAKWYILTKIRTNDNHNAKTELIYHFNRARKKFLKLPSNRQTSANRQKKKNIMSYEILLYFVRYFCFFLLFSLILFLLYQTSFHRMKISGNKSFFAYFSIWWRARVCCYVCIERGATKRRKRNIRIPNILVPVSVLCVMELFISLCNSNNLLRECFL